MANSRMWKYQEIEKLVEKKNSYLKEHPRAKVEVAIRDINKKIEHLNLDKWVKVSVMDRFLKLERDELALEEESMLDGCYVIKTSLSREMADKDVIHSRHKDLALVETAFRNYKSTLEVRPVFVRTKESTCGHVLVVMLAYMIMRRLSNAWSNIDTTVERGIAELTTLCTVQMKIKGHGSYFKIPSGGAKINELLKALSVKI